MIRTVRRGGRTGLQHPESGCSFAPNFLRQRLNRPKKRRLVSSRKTQVACLDPIRQGLSLTSSQKGGPGVHHNRSQPVSPYLGTQQPQFPLYGSRLQTRPDRITARRTIGSSVGENKQDGLGRAAEPGRPRHAESLQEPGGEGRCPGGGERINQAFGSLHAPSRGKKCFRTVAAEPDQSDLVPMDVSLLQEPGHGTLGLGHTVHGHTSTGIDHEYKEESHLAAKAVEA